MTREPGPSAHLRYVAEDAGSGYGESADRLVRALRHSGLSVEYRSWHSPRGERAELRRHRRDPHPSDWAAPGRPTIAHLVPEHYRTLRAQIPGGPFLAHTVWETDRLPHHWPALLNEADRVLVPTDWNRTTFRDSGVSVPISVVPHIACAPFPGDRGDPLQLPPDYTVFYTVCRWNERKAPWLAIEAFLEAFTADDPVALVVKTSSRIECPTPSAWGASAAISGTTTLELARLLRPYARPPLVRLEVGEWTPERLAGLHARGDCYMSLSHGEGWEVGAFDAAAYGNPVVITGWGAPLSYLDDEAASLVDYTLEPVEHTQPSSYSRDQQWAVARPDDAARRLREVADDLDGARRRAAPLQARVLAEYASDRVISMFRDDVPDVQWPGPARRSSRAPTTIPRVAHFVFGLGEEPEPLHLVHYLAIASCVEVVKPAAVHLHVHHEPLGPYWERLRPDVHLHHVSPVGAVTRLRYPDPYVERYRYAHHADFIRLDVLAEHGGLYADLDTLFVSPIPDELWAQPFVIGREADIADPESGHPRPALSNALLMASPGSAYLAAWRAEIGEALDGGWATHSCVLAAELADRLPSAVHVEPQRTFHAFEPTRSGIARLLEGPPASLEGVLALHLAAHLWWDPSRRDFSELHARVIDEDWVHVADATYAVAARRFLP